MATLLQKIQDTAGRIARLGKYVESVLEGPYVVKTKGVVHMHSPPDVQPDTLVCNPHEGRIWWVSPVSSFNRESDQPEGLRYMEAFEERLLIKARAYAREEVLNELVTRKIRRITKPKTRGFKADQKRLGK